MCYVFPDLGQYGNPTNISSYNYFYDYRTMLKILADIFDDNTTLLAVL